MWDTLITLAIVAAALVYSVRRVFFSSHCAGKDCKKCSSPTKSGH